MLKVTVIGLDAVMKQMRGLEKQVKKAASVGLNESAKKVRNRTTEEFGRQFRNPTDYTKRAMRIPKTGWATPDKLSAVVELRNDAPGKGTPWDKALGHHFTGGQRQWKKFEAALFRIGVLPAGMAAVPAKGSWAVRLSAYGNISPGQIVQLLAYFQAFGEQGYKANMNDAGRGKLAKMKGGAGAGKGSRRIAGVVYFVSRGKGNWFGNRSWRNGRMQHLPPGIWAKRGTHGADVAPVLLFVRRGSYRKRIDLQAIANEVVAKEFNRDFNAALTHEIGRVS